MTGVAGGVVGGQNARAPRCQRNQKFRETGWRFDSGDVGGDENLVLKIHF